MATRLFVDHIPRGARERDIERFFRGYGRIREISLRRGCALVELASAQDARDAARELNGRRMLGPRVSVEFAIKPPNRHDDGYGSVAQWRVPARQQNAALKNVCTKTFLYANPKNSIEVKPIAVEYLVEIFSFVDRRLLETVVRRVSRKFDAISSAHFAQLPYLVIDTLTVEFQSREFSINDTNFYRAFIRERYASEGLYYRLEASGFERAAVPAIPRYLRVLNARLLFFKSKVPILRDVIAMFAGTWADYAPGYISLVSNFLNDVKEVLSVISVPALRLACGGATSLSAFIESLFDAPAVRECARLEFSYPRRGTEIIGSSTTLSASAVALVLAWLHSEPKMRSSHQIGGWMPCGGREKQREAKAARRDLHLCFMEWSENFDHFEPLVKAAFAKDTIQREFEVEFNFLNCFPYAPHQQPPSSALFNERTRECLRLEWLAGKAPSPFRHTFRVTRAPLPPPRVTTI